MTTLVTIATLVVAPAVITVVLGYALVGHGFAFDFNNQYWVAGRRVLDGLSPYDLGWQDINNHIGFPYGAVAALLFVPFGLLPQGLADAVFTGLLLAAIPATLRLLGVRDWRVYGIAFLWMPVIEAWGYANVSLLLLLGVALMWRYRDRPVVAGLLLALLVSIKLFVWPLGLWLLGTRRYAALAYATACGLALNLAAWAVIGFDQLGPYVKVLGLITARTDTHNKTTLRWVLVHFGAVRPVAYALMLALAGALAVGCFVLARRGREKPALMLCIALAFVATPVTWPHYWVLLIAPLALLRPKLGPVWAIPVAMAPAAMLPLLGYAAAGAAIQNALAAAVVIAALRSSERAGAVVPRLVPA